MKKRMGIVAAVATAMLCSSFAFAAPINIGLMAPITGAFASEGQDMQKICELMTEELNKAGGINGNKVQLVIEDDGSTPRSAATAASRLVAADVCAAIGTYGSAVTEASQDIYDEAGIVQIGTGSTSIRLTAKGMKRFFRTCPRDDEQGRVAQSTLAKFGFKKVAILHDNSAYAKGLADEAKQRILDKKSADIVFLVNLLVDVFISCLHNVKQLYLIAFAVGTDRFIEGDLSGRFLFGAEHHQNFIFNAAGGIGGKPVSFFGVKGNDCLDQPYGSDGDQIFIVFLRTLVFFDNMCHKPEIVFDQNVFCFKVALCVFLHVILFLSGSEGSWK